MFQQHLGMWHQSDGTGASVEKPVNTPQGVQNTALHQNDPFTDTTPENHHAGFNPSALGLYGEGGGVYDFGGLQSRPGLNQICPHQLD
jgi:hypothetical protein